MNRQIMPVKQRLTDTWILQHELQEASAADKIVAKTAPVKKCLKYGMCICDGQGLHARLFHQNLAALLKPKLIIRLTKAQKEAAKKQGIKQQRTKARVMMDASMLVLKLSADVSGQCKLDKRGWPCLSSEEEDDADSPAAIPTELWWHISYFNFKDFEFMLTALQFKERIGRKIVLSVPQVVSSQRSCAALADLDLGVPYTVSWYKILSDQEVLPEDEFKPNTVEVVGLDEDILPSYAVWNGLQKELSAKRREARKRKQTSSATRKKQSKSASKPASSRKVSAPAVRDGSDEESQLDDFLEGLQEEDGSAAESEGPDVSQWEQLADLAENLEAGSDEHAQPAADGAGAAVGGPAPAAAAAGPAVAAAAAPAARRRAASRLKLVDEEYFEIKSEGRRVGFLSYNARSNVLTARCALDHGDCRKQRTCKGADRVSSQGRPIGFLTAWLLDGSSFPDSKSHVHQSAAGQALANRTRGRELFMSHPGSQLFARHERAQRPGEPVEPVDFK